MFHSQHLCEPQLTDLESCLSAWRSEHTGMGVLVYMPEAQKHRVSEVQLTCNSLDIPLVGAVFPALITPQGFSSEGAWLIRMNTMCPHFLVGGLVADGDEAARQLLDQARDVWDMCSQTQHSLFLVFDAMLPHIGSLMTEVAHEYGEQLDLVGVNAGSETFQPMPCLFDNHRCVSDGVLGLCVPRPTALAVEHGYPVSQPILRATSTVGNRIDTINGRPALEVYQEFIEAEFGHSLTRDNFYSYGVHYPFGVITALKVLVRIPVALTEDGSIYCVGEVPANSSLRLLRAPAPGDVTCISDLAERMHKGCANQWLQVFYCAGRRLHFGDHAEVELTDLKNHAKAAGLFGALTLGELDTLDVQGLKFPQFHNAAVVCIGT